MWMGGPVPLGYDLQGRSLVINEDEAKTVRHIFERYVELRSVHDLKAELDRDGYVSKRRVTAAGRVSGAKPFSRGALYLLLQNRLYHGEIEHKGAVYPGLHEAIIDDELWDQVQAVVSDNREDRETGSGSIDPSLLAGLLFDENGNRLSPTHANKRGMRYRYYVSARLVRGKQFEAGWRLPAGDLEALVQNRVTQFLSDEGAVHGTVADGSDLDARSRTVRAAEDLASRWQLLAFEKRRAILLAFISRITVTAAGIELLFRPDTIPVITDPEFGPGKAVSHSGTDQTVCLSVPVRMRRAGKGNTLVIGGTDAKDCKPDPALVRLIQRAHRYRLMLLDGETQSIQAMADREGVSRPYLSAVVRLAFLAPEITEAIVRGEKPDALTAKRLLQCAALPNSWPEQKAMLGFPA
jgi:site-specific DNA recombinase